MAIGASGNSIVVFGHVTGAQANPNGGTDILLFYQLSEATIDGSREDGKLSNTDNLHSDFVPTDSEIEASLRTALAARLSDDFAPAVFIGTDIRGLKI